MAFRLFLPRAVLACAALSATSLLTPAGERAANVAAGETAQQRGYRYLTDVAFLPADFDQQVFDHLWETWEEPLRSQAAAAAPEERRRMALERYGLTEAPGRAGGPPLQYVDNGRGGWSMNCLACHTGKVAGKVVMGAPNTHYALQTLTEDVIRTKVRLAKPLGHMDLGSAMVPLGGSNGVTNAVVFGVLLMNFRDADLNWVDNRAPPPLVHHDHDAPAWWNYKKRSYLYADAFAPRGHRPLMQFLLVHENGPEKFRYWEDEFQDIEQWILSLEPPKYPWPIDQALASRGRALFNTRCSECHGTYGPEASYPEVVVPLDVVGTDRLRLEALPPSAKAHYGESWFNYYGRTPARTETTGYVAPPLDGIWASAPYLHNGSVPTLDHLFHPDERPVVWRRSEDGYDTQRVGLEVELFDRVPSTARSPAERRRYFDTRLRGKSAAGHLFPAELAEDEKQAVIEYLKTL